MNHLADKCKRHDGFTLVELLVVMAILAGLVTVTTVSVESTQDKIRADKTANIGRTVIEDLERSDRLSFVSDFGRLPADAEELRFLFSKNVLISGVEDPATAAAYQSIELEWSDEAVDEAFRDYFNGLDLTLSAGWRGPYSQATELQNIGSDLNEESAFLDGWKSKWRLSVDSDEYGTDYADKYVIVSYGRDRIAGGIDWQDREGFYELSRNLVTENVEQTVQVELTDTNGDQLHESDFSSFTLYAVLFSPSSNARFETINFAVSPIFESDSFSITLHDLEEESFSVTVGHRLVFVFATGTVVGSSSGPTNFASRPRLLHIKPGTNAIEDFNLTELP